MKNIVILGASSFVGRHTVKRLKSMPQEYKLILVVRNIDNCPNEWKQSNISILECEIESYPNIYKMLPFDIECLIPLTWLGTKPKERNCEELQEKSYLCMKECLYQILTNCKCKRVITPGTVAEYGSTEIMQKEDVQCFPVSMYGKNKYRFYLAVKEMAREQSVAHFHLRLYAIYGEDDRRDKLINRVMLDLLEDKRVNLSTKCTQTWNYVYINDLVDFVEECIQGNVESGCYNIGTMEKKTLKEYLDEMQSIINEKKSINYGTNDVSDTEVIMNGDYSKIYTTTKWRPRTSFRDGVKYMNEYYMRMK